VSQVNEIKQNKNELVLDLKVDLNQKLLDETWVFVSDYGDLYHGKQECEPNLCRVEWN